MEPIAREMFWNVSSARFIIYPLFLVAVGVLAYGLRSRVRLWRLGQPTATGRNLSRTLLRVFTQADVLRARFPGTAHFLLFWGFILLTIGTGLIFLQEDFLAPLFGERFLEGWFYLGYSFVLDLAGLAAILAVLYFAYRRYLRRPAGIENRREDLAVLALLIVVLLGGFAVEALRIAATRPAFEVWSPIGWALAQPLMGLDVPTLEAVHRVAWWSHMLLAFAFLAYVGYSKLMHIVTGPLNLYLREPRPVGALAPIENIEEAETYGVGRVEEFTWKSLLDTDACLRCGRCQDNCPAWNTQKPLNPRDLVQSVRDELNEVGPAVLAHRKAGTSQNGVVVRETPRAALIGGRISEDEIWACTTCRACEEHCPVEVQHVQKLIDLRRHLVLNESRFPQELVAPYRSLENSGCPWEIPASERGKWAEGLGIRTLAEAPEAEYLWWVGCAVDVDERNAKAARALARVLQAAKVDFAILGPEAQCCGDPARRTGNEYLFQMLAQANIELLDGYGVKKILVHCPHCFNCLKNEYPQFGGTFEVVHSSTLIADLLRQGRLRPAASAARGVTYHDPCYLGRHNGLYEAPRQALLATGSAVIEARRNRADSFCCGGGGGGSWIEERAGARINHARVQEFLDTGAQEVAVACPYCLSMLVSGVNDLGLAERLRVVDYVEVLAEALPEDAGALGTGLDQSGAPAGDNGAEAGSP